MDFSACAKSPTTSVTSCPVQTQSAAVSLPVSSNSPCPPGDLFCSADVPPRTGDLDDFKFRLPPAPKPTLGAYHDDGLHIELEPMQFLYGSPNINVTHLTKRDGKIILEGNGYLQGLSAFPPISIDFGHLQVAKRPVYRNTSANQVDQTGDFIYEPAAYVGVGLKVQVLSVTNHTYTLSIDEDQFYEDLENAAAQGGNIDFNAPELNDKPTADEIESYLEEYKTYINDVISDYSFLFQFLAPILDQLGLLDAQDYVQISQQESKETFFKVDVPISISIGSWLHDNGGQFFHGRVGVGRAIRIGARTGPSMIYGPSLGDPKFYANFGAFVDVSLLTFYSRKDPTVRSWDVHFRPGIDLYVNFNDQPDEFGSVDIGLAIEKRF